jgi:hypothetical protein
VSAWEWLATHRPRGRYVRLRDEVEALDRGVVESGVIASQALTRALALSRAIQSLAEATSQPAEPETASFGDPSSARIQARKRRIEASGLRVVR